MDTWPALWKYLLRSPDIDWMFLHGCEERRLNLVGFFEKKRKEKKNLLVFFMEKFYLILWVWDRILYSGRMWRMYRSYQENAWFRQIIWKNSDFFSLKRWKMTKNFSTNSISFSTNPHTTNRKTKKGRETKEKTTKIHSNTNTHTQTQN